MKHALARALAALVAITLAGACSAASDAPASTAQALSEGAAQENGRPNDWSMSTYDVTGSAHNTAENKLSPANVGQLEVRWEFDADAAGEPVAAIHAMPVVANGRTYVGSYEGRFYAIGQDGQELWHFDADGGIVGAAVLPATEQSVIFGDTAGKLYKLSRSDGSLIWTTVLTTHPFAGIVGNSLLLVGDTVIAGISSSEAYATLLAPWWPCCSHRGAVVSIDVATGAQNWRHETIDADAQGWLPEEYYPEVYGPSGSDVWAQPTFDPETNIVYFTTGQHFSRAPDGSTTDTSDAIGALDADTGELIWMTQTIAGDIWRLDVDNPDPATGQWYDQDFGDQAKIYRLADGTKVVAAGQKSGEVHVLDAATGAPVHGAQIIPQASSLGGFQTGGAVAGDTHFLHGLAGLPPGAPIPFLGTVVALSLDGTTVKWHRDFPLSALAGPIAVANGVVYVQSTLDEPLAQLGNPPRWGLYALDAENQGATLAHLQFEGRSLNGPVVSNGRVYAGTGNAVISQLGEDLTGSVLCLALPDDDE